MPELPEVETIVRDLRRQGIEGRRIQGAVVFWPRTIAGQRPGEFSRELAGRVIERLSRRGKFLHFVLSGSRDLFVHLRMSGRLNLAARSEARNAYERVVIRLDPDRDLRFMDARKFGRFYLTQSPEEITGRLGPEPLEKDFTVRCLRERIRGRKRQLKPLLLDQSFVAGLGNIYVDEALWEACLHPEEKAAKLNDGQTRDLHSAIRKVLKRGIANLGTTLGKGKTHYYSVGGRKGRNQDALNVFRRTGKPCPRCRNPVVRRRLSQRSTHFCAVCQVLS